MSEEIILVDEVPKMMAFDKLKAKAISKISEIIHDDKKMIWLLFDLSVSMGAPIKKYSAIDKYDWTEDHLLVARNALVKAQSGAAKYTYDVNDDLDVKRAVIEGVVHIPTPSQRADADEYSALSRLDMAKKCAKEFVTRCFNRFKQFKVVVATFSDDARLDCVCEQLQKTCQTIDTMQIRGGTCTFNALSFMLETCKLNKCDAGHRVVLVSDGYDITTRHLHELVDGYKKHKVICDAVFIVSDTSQDPRRREDGKKIIEFVKATGGVCEFIEGESEFANKFLKVASRGLLTEGGK